MTDIAAPAGPASAAETPLLRHRLYLVDGSGYIFRAYHALPPLSRKDGTPTGAVLGFCNMLYKLLEETLTDRAVSHLAVVFDAARRTFRNEIYPDYKAQRPEAPEDLVPQFPFFREAVRAFNVPCIEVEGFEADDVIATYARAAKARGEEVVIVSSDKDLMQLVAPGVSMLDPIKMREIGAAEVAEKFGVLPNKVIDVQALAGDSTDNVPGVPGIGVKTAAQLINEYGDLETLLARAGEIRQPKRRETLLANAEAARISRRLVTLCDTVELPQGIDDLTVRSPDPAILLPFLQKMEFEKLAARAGQRFADAAGTTASAAPAAALAAIGDVPDPDTIDYRLVRQQGELEDWIARAELQGFLALRVEASSRNPVTAGLVGLALAVKPGEACYIPLGHGGALAQGALDLGGPSGQSRPPQIPLAEALGRLKPLLEDRSVLKIGHDLKFAHRLLARYGIGLAPIDDTLLISYVLENGLHGHELAELCQLHLKHQSLTAESATGSGRAQVPFDQVAPEKALGYAAEGADLTLRLQRLLRPRLLAERLLTVYETIERPLVPVLAAMEQAGIRVDPGELIRLSQDFETRIAALERQIWGLAGESFNIGSPKQLGEILFERMSLAGGKKGKTGAYGTGADVLEALAAAGHDLPARVLDWRQLTKLKNTYTDALQAELNPDTGRVHTIYAMAATSTGRLSSSDPNLQNIPIRTEDGRKIRRAFVAEPGHKLLSADYSQIELRLLAHIADIGVLRDAFRDGIDIHTLTASQVFNVPAAGMDPMVRRSAKAINFGIIYGMSAFGLSQQLAIGQREAQSYIDAYFARYPGIRAYMEETKKSCRVKGFVTTLFGRRCHLPGINDRNPARRNNMERAAINAPIQGTAADIIKRAMILIPGALAERRLSGRMLLQVHDELVFEVPAGEAEETAAVVQRVMQGAANLSVPLTVETGIGDNWAEAH